MAGLENALPYPVIAIEREATLLMGPNRVQREHSTLEISISWTASRSLARTNVVLSRAMRMC